VLDRAADLIRGTFPTAWRVVLFGYVPASLLLSLPLLAGTRKVNSGQPLTPAEVYAHVQWLVVYLLADFVLLRQFVRGWLFSLAAGWMRGVAVSSSGAAREGLRRLPSAATATFLTGVLFGSLLPLATMLAAQDPTVIGLAMLLAPLLFLGGAPLALLGYVSVAVVHLESRGALAAIARSFRLCTPGFGLTLTCAVVLQVIRFSSGLLPALFTSVPIQLVLNTVIGGGLVILDVAVESILYFTLRCRREAYDLELMAREVELCTADELVETRTPAGFHFGAGECPSSGI
jgi:hypothetical protein